MDEHVYERGSISHMYEDAIQMTRPSSVTTSGKRRTGYLKAESTSMRMRTNLYKAHQPL
jgi:hypothetical protein